MVRRLVTLGLAATLLTAAAPALGQIPSGGQSLVASAPVDAFRVATNRADSRIVAVAGPTFDRAISIAVRQAGKAWDVELSARVAIAVGTGDAGLLRFWARHVPDEHAEAEQAVFAAYAQKASPNWDKSLYVDIAVGSAWQEFLLPFRWNAGYAAQQAAIVFGLGRLRQTVQIGGLEVLDYGRRVPYESLPRTALSYVGREPEAAWRPAAAARIEQHRKGPLVVRVVDGRGDGIRNADVRIEQVRHAFPFGSALQASWLVGETEGHDRYRARVLELFNAATLENDLKWPPWEGDWGASFDRDRTLAALRWLSAQRFSVRGHVLVWPGWDNLPQSITRLRGQPNAATLVPVRVLQHIDEILEATGPLVSEWDVVNEPYANHDLMDLSGWGTMIDWFVRGRRHLPDAPLYLNDYDILSAHGVDSEHQNYIREIADWMLAEGAPLSGLGFQGHFGPAPTAISRVLQVLDSFAHYGLPIRITEFDVDTDDEQLQADYLRDFLTAVFSHPSIAGFQMWGFWEGAHWRPRAAMVRRDWTEKPAATVFRDLVNGRWRTQAQGATGGDGRYATRGFYGIYRVRVRRDDIVIEREIDLQRAGASEFTISLPR
jgi:endo-1,4-beta-xylanase